MNAVGLQQLVERLGWTILHSLWQACVIGVAGDRVAYVKALLEMESLRRSAAPIALAASGGDLLQRARRLLEMRPTAGISSWWQASLLGLLVAGGVFSAIGGAWLMAAPLRDFQETAADGEATQEKRQDGAEGDCYVWHCMTEDKDTGEPVSQVRVTWDFQRSDRRADEAAGPLSVWKQEFVSDENGLYEVQVPKSVMDESRRWLGIEYRHPRYLPSRNSFWPLKMPDDPRQGLDHRHILLEPGVKVTGRVILPGGAPAVDVPVMFARSREGFGDSNGGYYHGFWTRTDQQGRYEFYTRNAWPQRIHWFPDKYECNSRALTREFGEQETIRLKEGLRLAGRVLDQQGKPLAQVVIRAATGTRVPYVFAASDDQGIFRFPPLPAGEYTLAPVRHYYDMQTGDSLTSELPTPIPAIRYVLDAATSSVDPKAVIQASPLVRIPVEVVDGTGKPLDGKMLSIGDLGDFENAVLGKPVEGEPGRYEFQYPQDQYVRDLRVRCSMGESAFYQLSDQFAPVAADAIVLGKATADFPIVRVVVRQAGTLKVTARTPDGKEPEGSSQIHVQYGSEQTTRLEAANQANRDPRAIFMAPGLMISYPAGEPWNTTIQQIAPGVPVLVTLQSDKYVAEPQTVTLADGETKSIELVVKP